ncbi:MAG TPA: ABC transporter substrate-binding protein [Thermoleophilia bacterium]|nr:ABC transporter substrate-binding protein [Thermoleophilia bacterium]
MKRIALLSITVVALVAALAAWPALAAAASPTPSLYAAPSDSASPGPGGKLILKIGVPEDIDGMNPFSAWSSITWEAFRINYNFLTWYDDNYKPVPDLAESWTTSPDAKVWTFKIRSGVTWQDGVPLTARDVAFTYNLILRNDLDAYTGYLVGVKKVTATDDTTLVIECDKPNAGMLALYIPILPEHIWSSVPLGKLDSWANVPTIGSGPFQVVEMSKSKLARLVANKDYFGGAPTIDEIHYTVYQNPESMVADYKAGNLDAVYSVPAALLPSLKVAEGWETVNAPYIGFYELGFNCWESPKSKGNPLLLDYRLRLACSWAIDRQRIVDAAMAGLAKPGTTVIFPSSPYHWEPPADELITYDPERAKQILDEAGYTDRDGDGVREDAKGKKLDFRLTPLTDYPEEVTAAKLIHEWLKDVGIKTRLRPMEEGAFYDLNYAGDFDMYLWSWGGDIDPGFMLSVFTTDQIQSWSDCFYSDPEYDALYEQQATAVNPADPTDTSQRKAIIDQMQQFLYRESPYLVLWYNVNLEAFRADKWTGWAQVPPEVGGPIWNFSRDTYIDLGPVTAAAVGGQEAGGTSVWLWLAIVAAVIIVVWIVVTLVRRRRGPGAEEM